MKTEILTMKLADLVPTENNPRQITKDDFDDLKKSIKEFPEMLDLREIVTQTLKRHNIRHGKLLLYTVNAKFWRRLSN